VNKGVKNISRKIMEDVQNDAGILSKRKFYEQKIHFVLMQPVWFLQCSSGAARKYRQGIKVNL
jgi:hypothetical protein